MLPDYSGIATIPMLWDWMHASIVTTFAAPAPTVLGSNRLLGKVRLRQLRVRGSTCDMREVGGPGRAGAAVKRLLLHSPE